MPGGKQLDQTNRHSKLLLLFLAFSLLPLLNPEALNCCAPLDVPFPEQT